MKDFIFSLSGLAPLRDPVAFSGAVLGEYGWEAEWPQFDIQIGADTLFADMLDQRSETPADRFTVWRVRNNLSLAAASRELGVTVRTISAYGSGARPMPRTIELAYRLGRRAAKKIRLICVPLKPLFKRLFYFRNGANKHYCGIDLNAK